MLRVEMALLLVAALLHQAVGIHYIVLFGRTGVGKSYIANRLAAPGQEKIRQCSRNDPCTQELTFRTAFNGDMIVEVPGYGDDNDQVHQATFVEFLSNKSVRALLFIFESRADTFMKAAANSFTTHNELRNKLIFVKNKVSPYAEDPEPETLFGYPQILILLDQKDMSTLKNHISAMSPVTVRYPVMPVSLFCEPAVKHCHVDIIREEVVEVFLEEQTTQEPETYWSPVHVGEECKRRPGVMGWLFGDKSCSPKYENRPHTRFVDKKYRILEKIKLTYAKRFDGVAGIHKKEHVGVVRIKIY